VTEEGRKAQEESIGPPEAQVTRPAEEDEQPAPGVEHHDEAPSDESAQPPSDESAPPPLLGRGIAPVPIATWVAIIIAAVIALSLLLIAGQMRYQGCVDAARARAEGSNSSLTLLTRKNAIAKCSQSPF
jgi:hypothetical protein